MALAERLDLAREADIAVGRVLAAIDAGAKAITVKSPPGSGKTALVEMAAVQEAVIHKRTVAIATTTRSQGYELVSRLTHWEGIVPVWFVPRSQKIQPPAGVTVVTTSKELRGLEEGAVVVATAAKWARTEQYGTELFICDEAWQLSYASFAPLAPLSQRFLLVGDPGQIAPVTQVDVSRWADDVVGPHLPAPDVLHRHHQGSVVEIPLPATRRLPADTASVVSAAFYPTMPFGSIAPPAEVVGEWPREASLAVTERLGPRIGAHDPELCSQVAAVVNNALAGARIRSEGSERPVQPRDIGVVCPYVHQVATVRARLGSDLSEVFVETANRWQGLERDLVVGIHPLSGQPEPSSFAMDAGRLCVMTSRHKVACVLLSRPGVVEAAAAGSGGAKRNLSMADSAEHLGWQAHTTLLERLKP